MNSLPRETVEEIRFQCGMTPGFGVSVFPAKAIHSICTELLALRRALDVADGALDHADKKHEYCGFIEDARAKIAKIVSEKGYSGAT